MLTRKLILSFMMAALSTLLYGQAGSYSLSGHITDARTGKPAPFAVIADEDKTIWTTADKSSCFLLKDIAAGNRTFHVYLLGYAVKTFTVDLHEDLEGLEIRLEPESLQLDEVIITAGSEREKSNASSSYKVDRTALDHLQATNVSDVMSLLPGGKSRGDINLTDAATRFEVRSSEGEMNSGSFATAVEVDGVRLSNNAGYGKMRGIDSRSIPITNVESVEIVTGIPSVEYGDLNSGMVKINTAKGRTPFIVEFITKPNTKLYSVRKGFNLGNGTLNASLERAESISDLVSPFTSYDRNGLTLSYRHQFGKAGNAPLVLNAGFSGNIGGYDSRLDPDQIGDSYSKERENGFRMNAGLEWVPGGKILNSLEWTASFSYTDNLSSNNVLRSNSASDIAVHTREDGYHVAEDFDSNPGADIVLLRPGKWYELRYFSSKPLYFTTKVKAASKNRYGDRISNHILLGSEYSLTYNKGRGEYYDDMRVAPSWRPYLLYENPPMHNLSVFLEDNLTIHTAEDSYLKLMAGVRGDFTFIKGSDYKTVMACSPRINLKYVIWENRKQTVSDLDLHIGWGRSVKLPSFDILYPRTHYMDLATFTSASDGNNIAFQAYRTFANTPLYNKDLHWQSSGQFEIGAETVIGGFGLSLLFFMNEVRGTFLMQDRYRPFSYNYTGPSALEGLPIPSADRIYSIDKETGIVTVTDRTGNHPSSELEHNTYQRFIADGSYVNGSPSHRLGIEYVLDFPKIKAIHTQFRIDGNYYRYEGINEVMCQDTPGILSGGQSGRSYRYIAHYAGPATPANGSRTQEANLNVMMTTHIPKIRFIVSIRLESTLMNRMQNLSESSLYQRSSALGEEGGFIGPDITASGTKTEGGSISTTSGSWMTGDTGSGIYNRNSRVATYPMYYSTWEEPEKLIPFMEKFLWARDNDPGLYNDLSKMVKKSNYPFFFDERRISPYYAVSINLTKEFGRYASVSFYSTNFLNNMQKIRSNWDTMKESSIYEKGYISRFSYGLSIRLKF